jgi:hypothetical protein
MTKLNSYFVLFISFILFSCSSDNENIGDSSNFSTPLNLGNYWTYDVESQGNITRDSLFVDSETTINNNSYKIFKTRDDVATGFYSSALRNNKVRENNGKLLLTGDLAIAANQTLPITLDLTLNDFIIFDKNASNNQALNTNPRTGTINETINSYPLSINYSLQTFGGENFTTFTSPDGTVYSDVKSTKIKLNVNITTEITVLGATQTITALAPQDVLIATLYIANGIGVVYTNTVTTYSISSFIANELSVPETDTQTQDEFLDTYSVN